MKVSDHFVECLEQEGVEYIFGLPGEENEDLLFSLSESTIEFIPTRHEQGAAFMADVWGRLTGDAGVCLSTLGPGATNLFTGVADANLDKSPLVAITGQGGLERLHQESHQNIDVVNMFKPITKWNNNVADPEIVSEVVRKAFKIAEAEKPGATHIELSEDVARKPTSSRPLESKPIRRPSPDPHCMEETIELLHQANRPLIMAGNGAIRTRCSQHLRDLAETHEIPVVHTFMGKGAVDDRSEQSLFSIGLGFRDYVMEAVDQSDLILTVGYDIAEYAPESWNPNRDKRIVHVDFEPAEVYTHYVPEVELVCDIPPVLKQLKQTLDREEPSFDTEWYRPIRSRIHQDIMSYDPEPGEPLTTPGVIHVLRRAMGPDDLMISDVGAHKMWIARNFMTCCPNGCIISNGLASMGIALPGGVAASLVDPDRNVVCAMGDGGFLMNAQELETARRVGADFTCVVFRDDDYGLISWKQEMNQERSVYTEFGNPRIDRFTRSFGIKGVQIDSVKQLNEELPELVRSDELCVVDVPVSTHVNRELTEKLKTT